MKKIVKIDLEHLKRHPWFQLMKNFYNMVREKGVETYKILDEWALFLPKYQLADQLLQEIKKSDLTKNLADLDAARDELYTGFKYATEAYLRHFDTAKRTAAYRISIVLKSYKNVTIAEYEAETSQIYNVVQELQTNYAADITALDLTLWLTELDKANKTFQNLWNERIEKAGAKHIDAKFTTTKKELSAIYRQIITRLEALCEVERSELFISFINNWNEVVTKAKNLMAQQQGRRNADDNDNENT